MTTANAANDFLMGTQIPSFKFDKPGATVIGYVDREPELFQQRDINTKEPLFWKSGEPKNQTRIVLELVPELQAKHDNEDGLVAIYVKGLMQKAIGKAVRDSGASGVHKGGKLKVTFTALGEAKNGLNAPKLYTASYKPPADEPTESVDDGEKPPPPEPSENVDPDDIPF